MPKLYSIAIQYSEEAASTTLRITINICAQYCRCLVFQREMTYK